MAITQGKEIGVTDNIVELSILQEDTAKRIFDRTSENIYYTDIQFDFHKQFYIKYGADIAPLIGTLSETNTTINLIRLNDGFIKLKQTGIIEQNFSGGRYISARSIRVFYQKDGSSTEVILLNSSPTVYLKYISSNNTGNIVFNLPVYLTVIYDDDLENASIALSNYYLPEERNSKIYFSYSIINITYNYSAKSTYVLLIDNLKEYDTDPWSSAGYSEIGGGDGTFDFNSDNIDLPDLPSIDAVSSGFLQLFTGSLSNILDLSRYMWSANFFDNIVKITANPIEIIMGLYMYPFIVPASNQKYIRAGNVITNIKMYIPNSQIFEIDCGSVDIPNFYGAYLDYEPFTKCDLFLPYCGTFPLSMDDIAGKTINVKYRIDLLTGVCGAYVIIDGAVRYNFVGTCAINIPISSRSFENLYSSIMGVVGSMFSGSSFGLPSVGSSAGIVTSGKNQIQHGGNCSGNAGYLGVQKPYLIFSVPRVAIPKGLNTYTGYPIFATYKLANLKGYTEIEQIHLENMGQATKEEIDKITSMLEGGVIL